MEKHMAFGNTPPRHTRRDALKGLAGFAVAAGILPLASFAAAAADSSRKILIAYFSHTGNTRAVAGMIHAAVGGDIFEIQAAEHIRPNIPLRNAEQERNGKTMRARLWP